MAQEVVKKPETGIFRRLWPYICIAALPVISLIVYYMYNGRQDVMDWVNKTIAAPYREVAAKVTSTGPFKHFSVAEVLLTLLLLWALIYILKTIIILIVRPQRLLNLTRRIYVLLIVGLYIFTAYSWLWGSGYRSTALAEKTGLISSGISTSELVDVTRLFAEKANTFSGQVKRDSEGHFNEDENYYFALGKGVYTNIAAEIPALEGAAYPAKAMIYSKLMSYTGFTGVYIALTGETNINVDVPGSLIPATIAHEMAHQRGINAEEEANFAGIAACITSNITIYEYSGYLDGLIYLSSALNKVDPAAWSKISATLNEAVVTDWTDNIDYWNQFESDTSEAVTAMYDSYLKQNGVEAGIKSYGACVDMLVTWLAGK